MMSSFIKRFVRVEWLAFQKAVDLMREVGFDNSYFVGNSESPGDEGRARILAEIGRELFDHAGLCVKHEELRANDLGLEEEIGEFGDLLEQLDGKEPRHFLKRTYVFQVFRKGEKGSHVMIWVSFAKPREQDDWELVHEAVVDQWRSGGDRYVIYRDEGEKK